MSRELRSAGLVIAMLGALHGVAAVAAENTAQVIDRSTVFAVGPHRVSRYLFDKYHRRFVQAWQAEKKQPPNSDAHEAWIEQFIAQQVVTAHAGTLGYLEHPEVVHMVTRMERHMLTQTAGPLYQKVAAPPPRPEGDLLAVFLESTKQVDAFIVRFPDDETCARALGADFISQPSDEQMHRIRACLHLDPTIGYDGRLNWPYKPFIEISSRIARTTPEQWLLHAEPGFGIYAILVRSFVMRPPWGFESSRTAFEKVVHELDRQVAQKRHRLTQLHTAELTVHETTRAQLLAFCQSLPERVPEMPEIADALSTAVLFTYRRDNKQVDVTGGNFRRSFNDQMMRHIPRSQSELKAAMEDHVIRELDLWLARAKGLDESPQFIEDRLGFTRIQALDLYEREVLSPKIEITPDAITRCFQANPTEFSYPGPIHGRLHSFPDIKSATDWVALHRTDGATTKPATATRTDRNVVLSREQPLPGLESLYLLAMASSAGEAIGPLPADGLYHVFVNEGAAERNPLVLPQVQEAIRLRLLRASLDARIRDLARELVSRYPIEDHIDYTRYGVDTVAARWWSHR
jgi:hypothetical protein